MSIKQTMTHLEKLTAKIIERSDVAQLADSLRAAKKTIVFTNGCFDIVHRGHIEYLAKAADLGDYLFIGLNSDDSVRRLKGASRPVNNQIARTLSLAAFQFTGFVSVFDEDTPYELIKLVRPDILVKGSDYQPEQIVGYDIVTAYGGKVCTVELTDGYSTTELIRKINQT